MLRRSQSINIPTDVLRTVVSIVDLGSYVKAGERLGLSQPAISAQIKRLQVLIGGSIFSRTSVGVTLNDRGKLLLPLIRRLLDLNDQILQFSGAAQDPRPTRLGLSEVYGEQFLDFLPRDQAHNFSIVCEPSQELLRGLADGYLDVCAVFKPSAEVGQVVHTWKERLIWVRSPDFVVGPGSPIPIVAWPGLIADQLAVGLFETKGLSYRIAFTSPDRHCRMAAVRAGIGILIVPDWAIPDAVVEAEEYYLPPVPTIEAGIIVRHGLEIESISEVVSLLKNLVPAARHSQPH